MAPARPARSLARRLARPAALVGMLAGALLASAGALDLRPGPSSLPSDAGLRPVSTSYPTNAAKIFKWGNAQWSDGFVGPLASTWAVNRPGLVRNQNGMLTLEAEGGDTTATLTRHARQYGRWEARVRARQYTTGATPYHVVWELIPTTGSHCGARNLVLGDYVLGRNVASLHVRNTPDLDFSASTALPLTDNEFHTYAIEVTRDHVSWFVDTRVVRTERRPAALTGATYAARFRLAGKPGARMNKSRMQMDWVRYYTLERPNARSIEAPQTTLGTYAGAC